MGNILVVEDEYAIAELIQDLLEDEGYAVLHASNGQIGWQYIQRQPPDLVLTDLMMPQMDGIELCQALQAHPQYHVIPVVLMSAGVTVPTTACHYAAFIPKPFDVPKLVETIEHQLAA